ncbi:MAG: NAD-dependent epimerase/dehydratase family protein [Acidimicrobiia bacterium]
MSLSEVAREDLVRMASSLDDVFAEMSGRDLLITGGAGFLGYYLVQAPLEWNRLNPDREPIRVAVYDNFFRGRPLWLDDLNDEPHLTVDAYDLRDPLPDDMGDFDFYVHAAGIASPRYYRLHPIETMDANISGLRSLLDHVVSQSGRKPARGFLFFSSSEIYGDPPPYQIPTPETYRGNVSCTGPRACYDESKRYGETLCVNFAQVHDLPVTMARPFNNYGPGMKITDGRVIADFARNIVAGENIVMHSDGSPTRTFCYATDAVSGYFRVLVLGKPGEPYNVGTTDPEISMADLAVMMTDVAADELGYGGQVVRQASDEADFLVDNPNRRCPDITKARAEIGYEPSVDLEEGLRRTIRWYADNPEGDER